MCIRDSHEEQSEYLRDENLTTRISLCIENTVKELIPVQQILQTYMSQDTRDISLDGEVEDTVDPDVVEGEDEPMGGLEPESEPMDEPMPVGEPEPEPTGLENEFKTVPGVQAPEPEPEPEHVEEPRMEEPQPEDDDVLFGDAPEQRTKNPRYN